MKTTDHQNQTIKSNEGPSLGESLQAPPQLTDAQAARRLELRGFWACERKQKIRVVEFDETEDGSASRTRWFDTWQDALKHYGMTNQSNDLCPICGTKYEDAPNMMFNRAGNWVCSECELEMTQTANDLFYLSQGRWKV